jgi:peptide/nickel transport system permease protein
VTVTRHVLANVWVPILTVVAITINVALAGAVVIEQVFNLPGLGRLVVQAVLRRDYPVIQGSLLVVAAIMVTINLVTDLLYAYLDPRIRYE